VTESLAPDGVSGSGAGNPQDHLFQHWMVLLMHQIIQVLWLQYGIWKPKVYIDGIIWYGLLTTIGEPEHHHEALGASWWKLAMDHEYNAPVKNNTCHLVPQKKGSNIIDCKWVYKMK
jgi:hypothetical protein